MGKEEDFNNDLENKRSDPRCFQSQSHQNARKNGIKRALSITKLKNVPPPQRNRLDQYTPITLFELFFDEEVVHFIVNMANLFAQK